MKIENSRVQQEQISYVLCGKYTPSVTKPQNIYYL